MSNMSPHRASTTPQGLIAKANSEAASWLLPKLPTFKTVTPLIVEDVNQLLTRLLRKNPRHESIKKTQQTPTQIALDSIRRFVGERIQWLPSATLEVSDRASTLLSLDYSKEHSCRITLHPDLLSLTPENSSSVITYLLCYACVTSSLTGQLSERAVCGFLTSVLVIKAVFPEPDTIFYNAAAGFHELATVYAWSTAEIGYTIGQVPTGMKTPPILQSRLGLGQAMSHRRTGRRLIQKYLDYDRVESKKNPLYRQFSSIIGELFSLADSSRKKLEERDFIIPCTTQQPAIDSCAAQFQKLKPQMQGWITVTDLFSRFNFLEQFFEFSRLTTDLATFDIDALKLTSAHRLHPEAGKGILILTSAMNGYTCLKALIGEEELANILTGRTFLSTVDFTHIMEHIRNPSSIRAEILQVAELFDTIFLRTESAQLVAVKENPEIPFRVLSLLSGRCYARKHEPRFKIHDTSWSIPESFTESDISHLKRIPILFVRRFGFLVLDPLYQTPIGLNDYDGMKNSDLMKSFFSPLNVFASIERALVVAPEIESIRDAAIAHCLSMGNLFNSSIHTNLSKKIATTPNGVLGSLTTRLLFTHLIAHSSTQDEEYRDAFAVIMLYGSDHARVKLADVIIDKIGEQQEALLPLACALLSATPHKRLREKVILIVSSVTLPTNINTTDVIACLSAQRNEFITILTENDLRHARTLLSDPNTPRPLKQAIHAHLPTATFASAAADLSAATLAPIFQSVEETLEALEPEDMRRQQVLIRQFYYAHKKSSPSKTSFTNYLTNEEGIQNHYAILGVPLDASPEEIQASYRLLSRAFHPDLASNAEERRLHTSMQSRLNLAKECLTNTDQRLIFDTIIFQNKHDRSIGFFPNSFWFDDSNISLIKFRRPARHSVKSFYHSSSETLPSKPRLLSG